MKKNIMIVSNVTGGLYSFRKELIQLLCTEYDVYIYATDGGRVEDLEALGAKVTLMKYDTHGTNPAADLKTVSYYKKEMKKLQPVMVLTYTIKPNIYAGMAAAKLGIPCVANITGLGPAVENPGLLQKITVPLYRHGLKKAQKVFFQNQTNFDFMLEKKIVRKEQCDLIPGSGVNLKAYTPLPYPEGETVDFVFIARIVRAKGIEEYLAAAKEIRRRHPETRFHICGGCSDEYKERIEKENSEGTVIYHGRVNDIAGMHRVSCCTVHPTFYPEGMSNVLLESCACARPIITTDRPGCREIVDNGINGFVVKQRDSADLIDKIEAFLALPVEKRREMGLAGRAKVEKQFDRDIVIGKYMDEIRAAEKAAEVK